MDFLGAAGVEVVPISPRAAHDALEAFSRYGKGMRRPAQLNLGDCFAYAQAKSASAPLLFKGDDFSKDRRRTRLLTPHPPGTRGPDPQEKTQI